MKIIDLPPQSISVDDFSARARSVHKGLAFDGVNHRSLTQLESHYYLIDPLYPIGLDERDAAQLSNSLGKAAEVGRSTLKQKMTTSRRNKVAELTGDILLDKATVSLTLPDQDLGEIAADIQTAHEIYANAPVMQNERKKYNHDNINALLGTISARALGLHVEARRNGDSRHARIIGRSLLSGIVEDSIGHMRVLSDQIGNMPTEKSAAERGRFMEVTAFTQKSVDWLDSGDMGNRYVRFALNREDRPRVSSRPRRGFDVLSYEDEERVPIQVKIAAGADYHPAIRIWRPTRPQEVMTDTSKIVDQFETVIDKKADPLDVFNARHFIATQFEEKSRAELSGQTELPATV